MNPHISVIIPAFNCVDFIERCLRSLMPQAQQHSAEIIVVDSSSDGTDVLVARVFPTVTLLHFSQRLFPGQARTVGIERANGDLIAFLDSDCTVSPNWLSAKLEAHRSGHEMVSGGIRCHPDCRLIGWAYYFTEFSFFLSYTKPGNVEIAGAGGNLSFNRALFELVTFRTPAARYALDLQLLRDLSRFGKNVYFEPSHAVFHHYDRPLCDFLKHEFQHGRDNVLVEYDFGSVRYFRNTAYLAAGPLLPFLKFFLTLYWVGTTKERLLTKFVQAMPLTFCGTVASTFGPWWGHCSRLPQSLLGRRNRG
ncbi:MAG: glycosyltransferase family 2 protein [Bacteroidota bacterium]